MHHPNILNPGAVFNLDNLDNSVDEDTNEISNDTESNELIISEVYSISDDMTALDVISEVSQEFITHEKSFNGVEVTTPDANEPIKPKHEGQKSKCAQCHVGIATKVGFQRHMESKHLGIRHNCNYCDKSFKGISTLKAHIHVVHEKIKAYKCAQCDLRFSWPQTLYKHRKQNH